MEDIDFSDAFCRFVQAQFDLFWVAVQVSLPFVVAGLCLGAMALDRRRGVARDDGLARAPAGRLAPFGTAVRPLR